MGSSDYSLRDRIVGAYMGSAAGDALGGPVEGWHAGMIKAVYNRVDHFLPYTRELKPGYALRGDPGSITDDTYICNDFVGFFAAYPDQSDRTAEALVKHMLAHARFEWWWPPAVVPLRKLESGEMEIEEARKLLMGGGAAWWTPLGLIHAGDPAGAYEETMKLSLVWRQPFEQNLISSVQAAVAAATLPDATLDSVTETLFECAGPLARKLLARAQRIAVDNAGDLDGFIEGIYAEALISECTPDLDGPMPESIAPANPYKGASVLFGEQIPLAFAAFVFGRGDLKESLIACVNLGRDADSIAATTGRLAGALGGLSGMPADWVETLQSVNLGEMDLLAQGNLLADLAGAD
jgi:hypothetical protein